MKKNIYNRYSRWDFPPVCSRFLLITQLTVIAVSLFFFGPQTAYSKGYTISRRSEEHTVNVQLDRYPMVLGDNSIEIEILDKTGRFINDAKVLINYYMPPMPRMAPMNYKVKASLDRECYRANMDIIMAGPWYIKIIFRYQGRIGTAKINVDAQ
jgi:hypothetical protein